MSAEPVRAFALGANLPWIEYGCDYGSSAWFPDGGLAARGDARARFDAALARLVDDGAAIVRLFLMCDCRSGVRFDEEGSPTGLDDSFFRDVDVAAETAGSRGISLMPVLLDFHVCDAPREVSGVRLGGHAPLVSDPSWRAAFLTRIVQPIAERYGRHPAIGAWDLFNEPDWCVRNLRTLFSARAAPFEAVRACLSDLLECVRSCAEQPVTVGSAYAAGLDLVRGLGLDCYQLHWYERFGWDALAESVERLALDRPVLLGEFPGRPRGTTPAAIVSAARCAGYAGALIWP